MTSIEANLRHAPATVRNRDFITELLKRYLPPQGLVLEIASGTGEHICHFASQFPALTWQPSDVSEDARLSEIAWIAKTQVTNVMGPVYLDASSPTWPTEHCDAVVNINMVHISPFSACDGVMRGCSTLLEPGGFLYMYGPFKKNGSHIAPSNASFDEQLRSQNAQWGVRDVAEVIAQANRYGLDLQDEVAMPANNLSLIFRK